MENEVANHRGRQETRENTESEIKRSRSSSRDDFWQILYLESERSDILLKTYCMSVRERRLFHQQWLDLRVPQKYRDRETEALLESERKCLLEETDKLLQRLSKSLTPRLDDSSHGNLGSRLQRTAVIMERREVHQQWLDLVPEKYRDREAELLLKYEKCYMINNTYEMSIIKRREVHQQWLDLVPEKYRDREAEALLEAERKHVLEQTENLLVKMQREVHQQWLKLVPEKYRGREAEALLEAERKRVLKQTENKPITNWSEIHQQWLNLVPNKYKNREVNALLEAEIVRVGEYTNNMSIIERREIYQEWVDSIPDGYRWFLEQNALADILSQDFQMTVYDYKHLNDDIKHLDQDIDSHMKLVQNYWSHIDKSAYRRDKTAYRDIPYNSDLYLRTKQRNEYLDTKLAYEIDCVSFKEQIDKLVKRHEQLQGLNASLSMAHLFLVAYDPRRISQEVQSMLPMDYQKDLLIIEEAKKLTSIQDKAEYNQQGKHLLKLIKDLKSLTTYEEVLNYKNSLPDTQPQQKESQYREKLGSFLAQLGKSHHEWIEKVIQSLETYERLIKHSFLDSSDTRREDMERLSKLVEEYADAEAFYERCLREWSDVEEKESNHSEGDDSASKDATSSQGSREIPSPQLSHHQKEKKLLSLSQKIRDACQENCRDLEWIYQDRIIYDRRKQLLPPRKREYLEHLQVILKEKQGLFEERQTLESTVFDFPRLSYIAGQQNIRNKQQKLLDELKHCDYYNSGVDKRLVWGIIPAWVDNPDVLDPKKRKKLEGKLDSLESHLKILRKVNSYL